MPNPDILTEIPPISGQDCFVVFDRYKREFCFPVHIHKEYELNLVYGARGATRIVGDSVCEISDRDLVLITGSYLEHAWLNGNFSKNADVHEVCVQFSPDLFESGFIDKKQFYPIKKMFEYARRGIAFSEETVSRVEPIVENLIRSEDRFARRAGKPFHGRGHEYATARGRIRLRRRAVPCGRGPAKALRRGACRRVCPTAADRRRPSAPRPFFRHREVHRAGSAATVRDQAGSYYFAPFGIVLFL